jgi:hypothetical protein
LTLRSLRGPEVVRHLFLVAAGVESMVVGETDIQGQVRRAYELALLEGTRVRSPTSCSAAPWKPASGFATKPPRAAPVLGGFGRGETGSSQAR